MNVSSIANSYSGMKQNQVQSAVQTQMLRKAMNTQTQEAQDLLQALPKNQTVLTPSYLGRNFDAKF